MKQNWHELIIVEVGWWIYGDHYIIMSACTDVQNFPLIKS